MFVDAYFAGFSLLQRSLLKDLRTPFGWRGTDTLSTSAFLKTFHSMIIDPAKFLQSQRPQDFFGSLLPSQHCCHPLHRVDDRLIFISITQLLHHLPIHSNHGKDRKRCKGPCRA